MDYHPKTLRVLRAKYGYAQKVMADKLGISISQYSKIENGDKPLHVELLIRLGQIFQMTPWQLLEEIVASKETTQGYLKSKAVAEAKKAPYDPETDGEELQYNRNLANHYERKYLALFSKFVELSRGNDPEEDFGL